MARRPILARRGLGLVELMLALAISACLLTAAAVGFNASFHAYRINQEQGTLLQSARLTMNRLTSEIRRTSLHQPANLAGDFAAGKIVADTGINLFTTDDAGADEHKYWWNAASQQVMMQVNTGTPHVLLDGVTAFSITFEPMRSPTSIKTGGGFDLLQRATITLTVHTNSSTSEDSESTGKQTVTLSGSAMPRRNVWDGEHLAVPISQ